ncbi:MAG: class I SAM-dependent methyltransferase [Desulfobacterales bacterium]|jgi:predicted O-methyltransferase YrrM
MDFATVEKHVGGIPYILPALAREIYDFIMAQKPRACLELGFAHGASSCFIAAALEEVGHGHLTAVDLLSARHWQQPAIEDLLARTGLQPWVTVVREPTSYTWFLKRQIEACTQANTCRPCYDFCFLDGAKNWTIDSAAFFLADKLLRPESWILFDDLQWTYASKRKEGKRKSDGIDLHTMGPDEIEQPHIELIFQLLVMQHPDYANFRIQDNWWAWAQKTPNGDKTPVVVMSKAYQRRLAEWERRSGRRHRAPFEPHADPSGKH